MNCTQANEMSIPGFLMSKGINPDKADGNNFWYRSPMRNEKTPSFKVCRSKNVWFDYGLGTGGKLVDLVCKLYNVSIGGALLILGGATAEITHFSSEKQESFESETRIEIKHLQPLQNKGLIQYLESRKINPGLASKYCSEAYYTTTGNDKQYFSIAFKNDSGGYELRNKYWKGSTSPKDITTIKGTNPLIVNVFEGFMDFLSALTWFNTDSPAGDTIVLNGVGLVDRFIQILPKYDKINLYLDNDNAGKTTASRIQDLRPGTINRSLLLYPDHKDFNEYLVSESCKKEITINLVNSITK